MLKKILIVVATLASLGLPVAIAAPAEAATPGCVTRAEFKAVKHGWKMPRVTRKFGTKGKVTSSWNYDGYAGVVREYRACHKPKWSYVAVTFSKEPGTAMRVDGKYAYWG